MNISWTTIEPRALISATPSTEVLERAILKNWELNRFLTAAAGANASILLCVNDPQRCTQTRPVLDLLSRLSRNLAASPGFRVLVATGTHRFSTWQRCAFEEETFTQSQLSLEEIAWHDATAESLVNMGGVRMNRRIAEHRFVLAIGSVEPHYFAGATGPHKTLAVGCASREDIERNHCGALDPASDVFRLQGNPVYEGLAQTVRGLSSSDTELLAIGQVLQANQIVAAAVGSPLDVTNDLLPQARAVYSHEVSDPVDILHLRVPPPMGRSFYQADKALKNNHLAVRIGGAILLEADFEEGVGPDHFLTFLKQTKGYAHARQMIVEKGYSLGDHKAVKLQYLMDPTCKDVRVVIATAGLRPADFVDTPIRIVPQVDEGLDLLCSTMRRTDKMDGLIIEDAGTVCTTAREPITVSD